MNFLFDFELITFAKLHMIYYMNVYTIIKKLIPIKFIKQKACQLYFWRELDLYYELKEILEWLTEEESGGWRVNQRVVSSWRLIWSKDTLASPNNLSRRIILPPQRYTLSRTPIAFTSSGFTRGSKKLSIYCGDVPCRTRVLRLCFFDGSKTNRTWLPPMPGG